MRSPTAPIEDRDQDNPQARDAWFMKGRTAPAGQSAAELRYRAHQRKMQMRALRARQAAAQSFAPLANLAITGWSPLGPAPMASDAGTGQDYGTVTGRVNAVAIDLADLTGNTVYVGGAFGGLWRSQNAADPAPSAVVWTPLTDDQPTLSFGAIAIQPGNVDPTTHLSRVILAGTGETNSALDSYYGLGILRSADEGATWQLITTASGGLSFRGLGVSHMAFSTTTPNTVVAAVGTAPVGSLEGAATSGSIRGLYTSTDAGANWTFHGATDPGGAISATSATSVVWNAAARKFFAAIRYHGFYSSADGISWTRLAAQPGGSVLSTTACPLDHTSVMTLCPMFRGEIAVVAGRNGPTNQGEMYAWYVDGNIADRGIWRTTTGGTSWTKIDETGFTACGEPGGCGTTQAFFNMSLAAVQDGAATDVYVGAVNEFKCRALPTGTATCGDGSWLNLTHVYGTCSNIARVHPDEHAIDSMVVGGADILFFGNDGGVYRALDGYTGLLSGANGSCSGANQFDDLNNSTLGSLSQFVSFSVHPTNPDVVLGGTQDNGSPATGAATTSTTWANVKAGDGGYNEINHADPTEWFSAYTDVSIQRCFPASVTGCNFNFLAVVSNAEVGNDTGPFYTPYILDPQSATSELIVGTCRIWRGKGDGTGNGWATGGGSAISRNFETGTTTDGCTGLETNQVRAIAVGGPASGGLSNVIYATTDGNGPLAPPSPAGGQIFATINAAGGTGTWSNVTHGMNPSQYTVSDVAIDSSVGTGQTAYVTIMGFGGPHVLKTINAGGAWTNFSGSGGGAIPDAPANAIAIDSAAGVIYVGTDVGVFSSPTSGANWTEVGPAPSSGLAGYLPNVPVTKLRLFNSGGQKLLRASTYGRGIWQFNLIVTHDYQITFSNSPQTIFPTQTATFNGAVTAQNGYTGQVTLTCTAGTTPPPATCMPPSSPVTPTSPTGQSFTVSASDAIGDYLFNIHGVGNDAGTTTHDAPITLHVVDFGLTPPSPGTITANRPNTSGATMFNVTATGSFGQIVNLSCSVPPPTGATCNFSPSASVSPSAGSPVTVTLTISTTASTPPGNSTVTISANTSGAPAPKPQTLILSVTALADYQLAISTAPQSTLTPNQVTFNGTVTAFNGYGNPVSLTCTGSVPAGGCSFSPSSPIPATTGGAPFNVSVGSTTSGTFSFNIHADGGAGAATRLQDVPVSFDSTPDFSLPTTSGSQTVTAGGTGQYTLNFAPAGSDATFVNDVTYSCSTTGFPNLSSCTFNPTQLAAGTAAGSGAVMLSIHTQAPIAALRHRGLFYAMWLPIPGLGLVFVGVLSKPSRRRKIVLCSAFGAILLLTLLQAACGGGGGGGGGPQPRPGTTPGSYTVTINATEASGSATVPHSTQVTLIVQ